jgi:hypothetical protein
MSEERLDWLFDVALIVWALGMAGIACLWQWAWDQGVFHSAYLGVGAILLWTAAVVACFVSCWVRGAG